LKNIQASRQNHIDGNVAVPRFEQHLARFHVPQLAVRAQPLDLRRGEKRERPQSRVRRRWGWL
jgi:hypothetical protein